MHLTDWLFFASLPFAVLGVKHLWDELGRWLDEMGL